MIFGTHDIVRGPSSPFEYAVSHRMQDLWLAFMHDPLKGPVAQGWPEYMPAGEGIEFAWNEQVSQKINTSHFDEKCDSMWVAKAGAIPVDHIGLSGRVGT